MEVLDTSCRQCLTGTFLPLSSPRLSVSTSFLLLLTLNWRSCNQIWPRFLLASFNLHSSHSHLKTSNLIITLGESCQLKIFFTNHSRPSFVEMIISTAVLFSLRCDLIAYCKSHACPVALRYILWFLPIVMLRCDSIAISQITPICVKPPSCFAPIAILRCDPIANCKSHNSMVEVHACSKWIWRELKVSFTASFVSKTINVIYCGLVNVGKILILLFFYYSREYSIELCNVFC